MAIIMNYNTAHGSVEDDPQLFGWLPTYSVTERETPRLVETARELTLRSKIKELNCYTKPVR